MKKLLLLVLSIGLSQLSYADYLDDWPDNALCGWMENPSTPSYMVEEVKTRGIICSGGNVINIPPELPLPPPEEGPELLLPLLIPGWKLGDPIPPEWIVYWEEHQSIRPGWKILEGTDLWVIDETNPYWQTEEGLNEKPPKIDPGIEYPPETVPGADPNPTPVPDPTDPNPPPKIDPGIEYPPETLPGADPKKVPDLPPEVDKPPTDPNPPPKLADPTVLQPIDPS
jgi:hypothetical protein